MLIDLLESSKIIGLCPMGIAMIHVVIRSTQLIFHASFFQVLNKTEDKISNKTEVATEKFTVVRLFERHLRLL